MTTDLPQPAANLKGEKLAEWIKERDALAVRGPVTLSFPAESVGSVTVRPMAGDPRELDAAGDVAIDTFEMAFLTMTTCDAAVLASLPGGALMSINLTGADDACLESIANQNPMMVGLSDSTATADGLKVLLGFDKLKQISVESGATDDAVVEVLGKLDVQMLRFSLPGLSGKALSQLLSTSTAKMAMPMGVTAEQMRTFAPLTRDDKISLMMLASEDVTKDDVLAAIDTLAPSLSGVNIMTAMGEGFIDDETYLQLQYKYPETEIAGRWTAAKGVIKLAAHAGVTLDA
jgi:hypothetical protein